MSTPFALARAQIGHAELLSATSDGADEARGLRDEAASAFAALGATPWLKRAEALGSVAVA
jgi:hypothetical protein